LLFGRTAALNVGYSGFFEEVFIYLFEDKRLFDDNTAVMFDHESREFGTVNEDKPRVDAFGVVAGIGAETRRGNEHSASGLGAVERPDEGLNIRAANMAIGVALGLDVNDIKSTRVQADEPVQARIARGAQVLGGRLQAPISHLHQQAEYQLFKERGRLLENPR
jgi:hypothetical protein